MEWLLRRLSVFCWFRGGVLEPGAAVSVPCALISPVWIAARVSDNEADNSAVSPRVRRVRSGHLCYRRLSVNWIDPLSGGGSAVLFGRKLYLQTVSLPHSGTPRLTSGTLSLTQLYTCYLRTNYQFYKLGRVKVESQSRAAREPGLQIKPDTSLLGTNCTSHGLFLVQKGTQNTRLERASLGNPV